MKKVKLVVWMLIIVFVAIVIYQNRDFFWVSKKSLAVDLAFAKYQIPEVEHLVIFGVFFGAGFLLGIYFLIGRGLKTKKKIKALKAQVKEQTEKAAVLEKELHALRGDPLVTDTSGNTDSALQATAANPGGQPPAGDNKP
ncbi:MAG: lipopolysaccharide assembly protein LapA domain-containing protein [Desulfobacterales bacterium]